MQKKIPKTLGKPPVKKSKGKDDGKKAEVGKAGGEENEYSELIRSIQLLQRGEIAPFSDLVASAVKGSSVKKSESLLDLYAADSRAQMASRSGAQVHWGGSQPNVGKSAISAEATPIDLVASLKGHNEPSVSGVNARGQWSEPGDNAVISASDPSAGVPSTTYAN